MNEPVHNGPTLDSSLVGSRFWEIGPDLLSVLRADGFFESANPAWQILLGWSEKEVQSQSIFELLHPDDRESTLGGFDHLKRGNPILRFENRYRSKDGSYRWFAWSAAPYADAYYCSGKDITDEKLQAAQLASREADLQNERETAELRDQFIAVLGHDLRNPLASIDAAIRLLRRENPTEKATTILGLMAGSTSRMASLIDNVLDFARGRLGGGIPIIRDANEPLEPVLRQIVAELSATMPERVIETVYDVTEPISSDRARIGQVASNLLANALTHGAPDQPVRMEVKTEGGRFELSVTNGGPAIPSSSLGRLFQPFFRGSARGSQGGLGLGLHIAAGIAKAHGGTISVDSTAEETRFTFRMPTH